MTSFCAEFQHGQHLSSREGKKEVTKGKEGKESGQSSGQSSPEGKLLQDLKYGWAHSDIHTTSHPFQKAFTQRVGIEATEVFKGGSLGHGTTVPGHYDIDLVLYSRSKQVCEMASATINNLHLSYFEKGPKLHGHLSSQEVSGPSYL